MTERRDPVVVRNYDETTHAADVQQKRVGESNASALYARQWGTSGAGSALVVHSDNSSAAAIVARAAGSLLQLYNASDVLKFETTNDGNVTVGGTLNVTGATTLSSIALTGAETSTDMLTVKVTGDSVSRFVLNAGGGLDFGPGNGAVDTNLYRDSANTLKTDDAFTAVGDITTQNSLNVTNTATLGGDVDITGATTASTIAQTVAATTTDALTVKVTGDTQQRLIINGNGAIEWGSGSAAVDTNIYRSGVNVLTTDNKFLVVRSATTNTALGAQVTSDSFDRLQILADGKVEWGPGNAARDTNLYRSAANTLSTDDALVVAGDATLQSALAVTGAITSGTRLVDADHNPSDHGFETWTHDPYYSSSSAIAVNGRVYVVKLPIRRACTIDTIWWSVATSGATPTAGQNEVGLYSSAGTKLVSANVDASISSTGAKSTAITAQALTAGFVWVAFVFNASTAPTLVRGSSFESTPNMNLATTALRSAVVSSGATALPASFDPATLSTSNCLTFFAALEAA